MSGSHIHNIRALLRDNTDGLTCVEIAARVGAAPEVAYNALRRMPDAYIDRWNLPKPYTAVWCVVVPPPNCPRPER